MLVKYYLSDSIKAPFEDFALGLRIVWASLAPRERERGGRYEGWWRSSTHRRRSSSSPPSACKLGWVKSASVSLFFSSFFSCSDSLCYYNGA